MKILICLHVVLVTMAMSLFAQSRPAWADSEHSDLNGYVTAMYDDNDIWAYDVGISYKATSEKRARIRADQDLAGRIGSILGTTISGNTDFTGMSEFVESYGEEMLVRYEEAINLAVKVKIPSIEHLEYYTEKGVQDDTTYYIVYVLGRYKREDFKTALEKIDFEKTIITATKRFEKKESVIVPDSLEVFVVNVAKERVKAILQGNTYEE